MMRPEITWANVKNDISRMQNCLKESLRTCESLEQGHLAQLKIEITTARQRIYELEVENASLRTRLQVDSNVGSLSGSRITESLQLDIDQHLLQSKQENDMLRKRIKDLDVQADCLKEQINIYKEDFEMERKDRENAQGLITDLQKQLAIISSNSRHLPTGRNYSPPTLHHHYGRPRVRGFDVCDDVSSVSGAQGTIAYTATDGDRLENADHGLDVCDLRESDVEQVSQGLIGRGCSPVSKFCTDGTHENGFIDGERFLSNSPLAPTDSGRAVHSHSLNFNSPSVSCQNIDLTKSLSCPQCWRTFAIEDHMLLLEHLEVCN